MSLFYSWDMFDIFHLCHCYNPRKKYDDEESWLLSEDLWDGEGGMMVELVPPYFCMHNHRGRRRRS